MRSIVALVVCMVVMVCVTRADVSGMHMQREILAMDFSDEGRAETLQEWLHDLPRYTFTFEEISNDWEPTSLDYYESLAMIASPFLVMGIVMVVVGICMSTVGFCCLKCWPRDKGGYSRFSRWWPALIVAVLAIFLLITSGIGFYAEYDYHHSFNEVVDDAQNVTLYEFDLVSSTISAVESYDGEFSEYITLPPYLDDWEGALSNATNYVVDATDDIVTPIENVRHSIIVFGFTSLTITCVVAVIGLILALLCFLGLVSPCVIILALSCISFCWICMAFNVAEAVFIADMCPEIDSTLQEKFGDLQPYVDYYIYCDGNATELFFPLPQSIDGVLVALDAEIDRAETNGNQTRVEKLNSDKQEVLAIQDLTGELMDCTYTMNTYTDMKETTCVELFNGLFTLTVCQLIAAVFLMPLVCAEALGMRRWGHPKKSHAGGGTHEERVVIYEHRARDEASKYTEASFSPDEVHYHAFDDEGKHMV